MTTMTSQCTFDAKLEEEEEEEWWYLTVLANSPSFPPAVESWSSHVVANIRGNTEANGQSEWMELGWADGIIYVSEEDQHYTR